MTGSVSTDLLATSLFDDIILAILREVSVASLSRHRALQDFIQEKEHFSSIYPRTQTKDIFGQEKSKLKGSETSKYLECGNCGRKISGGRFALHINKCLDRDRR
ncbi:SAGA-associated factor 11 [Metschnikowia aff. pulcherrima]|uniref:SAGA-associated factor 11 n=1 Tax=Metschnikowia aff. pulcherrima TaxID=2163413 RepID=A0A4P6XJY0_9ASCO|nr:SAGA-associated factor 11 [Metschnikowia aff. pulcherrima]